MQEKQNTRYKDAREQKVWKFALELYQNPERRNYLERGENLRFANIGKTR